MIKINARTASKDVLEMLARLQGAVADMGPVYSGIGQELESRVSARFETETDPEGDPWDDWRDRKLARGEDPSKGYPAGGHGRILDRYGDMLRSLGHEVEEDGVIVGFGAVASKSGDVYAVYHEWGTESMPRRGLLTADPASGTLSRSDEKAVLDVLEDYFIRVVGGG